MTKLYAILLFVCCASYAMAQQSVTFVADMREQVVDLSKGVHVAGNWQAAAGFDSDWDPSLSMMTDADGDGVYELNVMLPDGTYEYKFVNGNAWGSDEGAPNDCSPNDNGNRGFTVAGMDMMLDTACFGECMSCQNVTASTMYDVTFRVNMSLQTAADTVSIAGNFQDEAGFPSEWTPGATVMTDDDMDGIYEVTVQLPAGDYQYKYVNGADWSGGEGVPGACAMDGNRFITVGSGLMTEAVCFGSCDACPTSVNNVNVTLRVDMSNEAILNGISANGVSVAGNFQGVAGFTDWTPGATVLTDDNADGIYEVTVTIPEGTYQYKFINGNAWGFDEGVPGECNVDNNREMVIMGAEGENVVLDVVCFGECTATCSAILDPINVTFRVDMTEEINAGSFFAADTVYVAGEFQTPAWQKDVIALTPVSTAGGENVYETTVSIRPGTYQYKYFKFGTDAGQESGATFLAGGCGTDGFNNRILNIEGMESDTTLSIYLFDSCTISNAVVSVYDISTIEDLTVAPNPMTTQSVITFSNATGAQHTFRLFNLAGQVVATEQTFGNTITVERGNLARGVYFANLSNELGEQVTVKLVIQ